MTYTHKKCGDKIYNLALGTSVKQLLIMYAILLHLNY